MSLFEQIHTVLRSTGFVTNSQASDLAESVEGLIHNRERLLNARIDALEDRLKGLQAVVTTAKDGTDAMDAEAYGARALSTFEAICAPGLFEPDETEAVDPAHPPTTRLVIERSGNEIRATYSDLPVDIVIVNRAPGAGDDAEPESYTQGYAQGGAGRISDIERHFEDAEAAG